MPTYTGTPGINNTPLGPGVSLCQLPPDQNGYALRYPTEFVTTGDMDGGPSLSRKDFIGGTASVDVQWTCDGLRFQYMNSFYRTQIENGADWFGIALIFNTVSVQTYLVRFRPGTFAVASTSQQTTILKATLEVQPVTIDPGYDVGVMAIYNKWGDNAVNDMSLLAYIVNVQSQTLN